LWTFKIDKICYSKFYDAKNENSSHRERQNIPTSTIRFECEYYQDQQLMWKKWIDCHKFLGEYEKFGCLNRKKTSSRDNIKNKRYLFWCDHEQYDNIIS
jgi:hypothetical protein